MVRWSVERVGSFRVLVGVGARSARLELGAYAHEHFAVGVVYGDDPFAPPVGVFERNSAGEVAARFAADGSGQVEYRATLRDEGSPNDARV